ncbi:unnamed protein product, partial [Laminaria digitata]
MYVVTIASRQRSQGHNSHPWNEFRTQVLRPKKLAEYGIIDHLLIGRTYEKYKRNHAAYVSYISLRGTSGIPLRCALDTPLLPEARGCFVWLMLHLFYFDTYT